MKVGIVSYRFDYYPYTRNIIGLVPDAEYARVGDVYAQVNRVARKLNQVTRREVLATFDLNNQFQDFNLNKVDLVHFFNGISYGQTPWVSTFETILPRFKETVQGHQGAAAGMVSVASGKTQRAFTVMAGKACKRLIALSECSANLQRDLLKNYGVTSEHIESKLTVLHPPQKLLVRDFAEKQLNLDGTLRFMFVGAAFFRKGGRELLETFKQLRDAFHYNLELIIVSSLRIEDYAARETPADVAWAKQFLQETKDWIKHYPQLPNAEVLRLMKESHIGLLPTYADTYGYSVLEFQAAGCPVISTNVRALPEINDEASGWLIEVPRHRLGEATYTTAEGRQAISAAIRAGLMRCVHEIFANRSLVARKAENALGRIKARHAPEQVAAMLREIYRSALQ